MRCRQWSKRGRNRIAAEHVIMVPKAHRLTVDDQVMLYPLGLGAQLIILCDAGIEHLARLGVVHLVLLQLSDGRFDGLAQRRHCTQQSIQTIAVTPRLGGNFLQDFTFDRRQRIARL